MLAQYSRANGSGILRDGCGRMADYREYRPLVAVGKAYERAWKKIFRRLCRRSPAYRRG